MADGFSAIYCILKKRKRNIKHTCWVKNWIVKRNTLGAYTQFLAELRLHDSHYYQNFLRMSDSHFEFLVEKVKPKIERKVTVMRSAIFYSK